LLQLGIAPAPLEPTAASYLELHDRADPLLALRRHHQPD
jgi:hypothetical protein